VLTLAHPPTPISTVDTFRQDGKPHPDPIVETTTLARTDPPDPTYTHHLQDAVSQGSLSSLQIETVIYACQRHGVTLDTGHRAGFFLGDGAGASHPTSRHTAACHPVRAFGER
jgi:hypothetical protein